MPEYLAIAAMSANRIIGRNGALPWHLPEDLKFFRRITTGHPVLMGRRTWESLGRPLPNRRNLVLSRTLAEAPGAEIVRTVEEIDALCPQGEIFVIGGAEIYTLLLPRCRAFYLTVLSEPAEGDTSLPEFEHAFPRMTVIEELPGRAQWRLYER